MNRKDRLQHILEAIPGLSDFRLSLIDGIITILERKRLRDSGERQEWLRRVCGHGDSGK